MLSLLVSLGGVGPVFLPPLAVLGGQEYVGRLGLACAFLSAARRATRLIGVCLPRRAGAWLLGRNVVESSNLKCLFRCPVIPLSAMGGWASG